MQVSEHAVDLGFGLGANWKSIIYLGSLPNGFGKLPRYTQVQTLKYASSSSAEAIVWHLTGRL